MTQINLLSSDKYNYLKQNMLSACPTLFSDVAVEHLIFPDNEQYWRIKNPTQILGKPAVYICGTVDDTAIFEAYNMSCTLVREGCSELHLVLPYFGYSTMERAVQDGEIVTAKNIARLFSSIPVSAKGNHIYMVDLHSVGTQYYFERDIHPIHLTTWPIIKQIIGQFGKDVVLSSPDMGRAKWIQKMGMELCLSTAYIMKKRLSGCQTEIVALNADVAGREVIIFDDMIRSGSSIIKAAQGYKEAGAEKISVVCVHGVFVAGAVEQLRNSGLIDRVYCTNSHFRTTQMNDSFVQVYDISKIITDGILKCIG